MQVNKESALKIEPYKPTLHRIARRDAVLIKASELQTVDHNLRLLATLRTTNIVVTDLDQKHTVRTFLEKLQAKICEDKYWKPCANIRIVTVD